MEATIINNPVWEYRTGHVIKEETDFVTVQIIDKLNKDLVYNLRLPRLMVKTYLPVAQA